jgi:hypothetical protein
MALGDITFFQEANAKMLDGDWASSDAFWCGLVTNAVPPTAGFSGPQYTDFTEVTPGGNYAAGGVVLDTLDNLVTQSGAVMTFDSSVNPTWAKNASNPQTAYWAIVYNYTDANKDALLFVDLDGPVDMQAGSLTITWHTSGLFTITIT